MTGFGTIGDAQMRSGSDGPSPRLFPLARTLWFELLLLSLLATTLTVAMFQSTLLRNRTTIDPANVSRFAPQGYGDAQQGGSSRFAIDASRPLGWSCRLTRRYQDRFCVYQLLLDSGQAGHGVDLQRLEVVRLIVDYAGPHATIRVYMNNFDPRHSRLGDSASNKFNVAEVPVRPGRNVIDLEARDFHVAEWWVTDRKVPLDLSRPQFDNIVAFQIQTGTRAAPGEYRMRIERVTLSTTWLTKAEWYAGLLAIWAMLIGVFLTYRIVHLTRDLERRRQSQAAALRLARYAEETARRDPLTRLLNRTGITHAYHAMAMGGREGAGCALMLLDVDRFKQVNDQHGHVAGDEVLIGIAETLSITTRGRDIVGRWGGEEFLVVYASPDATTTLAVAEKLRRAIEERSFSNGLRITASIGVHHWEGATPDLGVAFAYADAALYEAKARGRNRVVLHELPQRTPTFRNEHPAQNSA